MAAPGPRIRAFTWADLPALARLRAEPEGHEGDPAPDSMQRLRRDLSDPALDAERDVLLAFKGDALVGQATLNVEPAIDRIVLGMTAHRKHGPRGVQAALARGAAARARDLGLARLQVDVPEADEVLQRLLTRLRFGHVRTHLHLRRPPLARVPVEVRPPNERTRLATQQDAPAIAALQNAAFTGSWGFSPNTPEHIAYRAFERAPDPPDAIVLVERDDVLVAYCWTRPGIGGAPGFIGMVGTHPALQGQGLGTVATAAGVNHLVDHGSREIDITVDSENPPAIRVYERLGFRRAWRALWYERRFSGAPRRA
ncbi:MAG: GNAT family N-acetyltransferase [SAR202 cluster bacterium]|nr:GNAT family N-acetyltransferase [SAR202 cluster bacterium]